VRKLACALTRKAFVATLAPTQGGSKLPHSKRCLERA